MIEPLDGLPTGVIGFRASGVVEPQDYTTILDPAIDAAGDEIRLVYVLGEAFEKYSAGAFWQDAKVGLTHSPRRWERIAVVTDHEWLAHSIAILGPLMPGKVKEFRVAERRRRDRLGGEYQLSTFTGPVVPSPWLAAPDSAIPTPPLTCR